jgi:predicted CopG family antitoxin
MTKAVSLSKKAYQTLKELKRANESFSDVVLRIADREPKKSILAFAGKWKGNDIDEVFSCVMKDRKAQHLERLMSDITNTSFQSRAK